MRKPKHAIKLVCIFTHPESNHYYRFYGFNCNAAMGIRQASFKWDQRRHLCLAACLASKEKQFEIAKGFLMSIRITLERFNWFSLNIWRHNKHEYAPINKSLLFKSLQFPATTINRNIHSHYNYYKNTYGTYGTKTFKVFNPFRIAKWQSWGYW